MKKPRSPKKITRVEFRDQLYRRRYVVPNIVTLGNLFCGFIAIIYASSGRFEKASLAIFIAIVLDGLDGRVARRLNATSKFGLEFDSFSDLVSFGVAPAMLAYHWCFLPRADEFGVFVCFLYALSAAGRLARFNLANEDLDSFSGLPSPGAALMVASIVFFYPQITPTAALIIFGSLIVVSLAFLMVANVEYRSIKKIKIQSMHPSAQLLLGALIAIVWYRPHLGVLVIASGYCVSGPAELIYRRWKNRNSDDDSVLSA